MAENMLTLKKAAEYLKVSERVISNFLDEGIFEKVRKRGGFKISQDSIDDWLNSLDEREQIQFAQKKTICRFKDYFEPEFVFFDFDVDNKYESIAQMCKYAKDLGIVRDNTWLYEVVVAREDLVSTAYGNGIALLHPRHMNHSKIKVPTILFGRSNQEVDFDATDGKLVNMYFLLLLKDDKQHLFSLSYISRFLKKEDNIEFLRTETDPQKIVSRITDEFYERI